MVRIEHNGKVYRVYDTGNVAVEFERRNSTLAFHTQKITRYLKDDSKLAQTIRNAAALWH